MQTRRTKRKQRGNLPFSPCPIFDEGLQCSEVCGMHGTCVYSSDCCMHKDVYGTILYRKNDAESTIDR